MTKLNNGKVMTKRKSKVEVAPRDKEWTVYNSASLLPKKLSKQSYRTKKEAESAARILSRAYNSELTIKDKRGRIQKKDSYGNDPYPPKG